VQIVNMVRVSQGQSGALDALLAGYAVGTLSAPLHTLVASHLHINGRNRAYVDALEAMRAEDILSIPGSPVADRDRRLAAIFDSSPEDQEADPVDDGILPAPLKAYMGVSLDDVSWKWRLPGVREARLEAGEGGSASIYWIRAGRRLPSHTHEGLEATLVLQGAFMDASGHYKRGDIAVADSDIDHTPIAALDEDCICFAVTEAPLRLTGPLARFMRRLTGH
jgi:putative transcriptional regulator